MGATMSQIASLTIVYSTVYSGADQRKHQSSASLAFVRGIHRGPVNSSHRWSVTRQMFQFHDVIMIDSGNDSIGLLIITWTKQWPLSLLIHMHNHPSTEPNRWQSMTWIIVVFIVMPCRMYGAKPLPEAMMTYYQMKPKEHILIKLLPKYKHFELRSCVSSLSVFSNRGSWCHDDVIKWKHLPRYWPFYRSPVNSPHKGQWRGALMFSLICVWINGWVNNREAGD